MIDVFQYREQNIDPKYKKNTLIMTDCIVKISENVEQIEVNGQMNNSLSEISKGNNLFVKYWASNPPDMRSSFAGSGLPFPNEEIAFSGSKNCDVVKAYGDRFRFFVKRPNSYYTNMGTQLVPPQVYYQICDKYGNCIGNRGCIQLGTSIPNRRLNYYNTSGHSLHTTNLYKTPQYLWRSQEAILRDSSYNNSCGAQNWWGLTPTH